ncbi:slit homolog 2 protein-like [Chenopodium quinoa]|uniref:slit homolog 2 protein-like n=1 Tax=Chenopodium quinoa TaxID=63459 RepID=UPI000B77F86D|nr:slit homolog 2 protein-like [Chenopodium quinoa]
MASNSSLIIAVFAILITILQPSFADSEPDFLSPLLSPILGNICKTVGCGKGKCKTSGSNDLEYECECDPGWRQTLSSNSSSDFNFKFLPCVIPNCTLNYSCSEVAPSPQSSETPSNASIFEPCRWANCGGGVCNKTTAFSYTCHCKEGYSNLLNNTGFPCFKECSIGGDCPNLGLGMLNKTITPPPSIADSRGSNQAWSQKHILSQPMILLLISVAVLAL